MFLITPLLPNHESTTPINDFILLEKNIDKLLAGLT
jgi:hypothetical protein